MHLPFILFPLLVLLLLHKVLLKILLLIHLLKHTCRIRRVNALQSRHGCTYDLSQLIQTGIVCLRGCCVTSNITEIIARAVCVEALCRHPRRR